MTAPPIALTVPESATNIDGLTTWLATSVQVEALATSVLGLIHYDFPLYIKIVLVRSTSLPYMLDPADIPGQQGRVDILISDGNDPDCLYQHIVLDTAFDFTNTQEWVVAINPLTSM